MRSLAIILALVGVSLASEAGFLNFAKTFNKKYGTTEEYNKRREIFLENYNSMVRHNQQYEEGKVSWWRKVTEHYDLTAVEREAALNLNNFPSESREEVREKADPVMEERILARAAPDSWSWKEQGGVSSVKNQGPCGSCAVFAAVAVIDTCFWQVTGVLEDDLSEQHLMDCAYGYMGNSGCEGGYSQRYMKWINEENDGFLELESCDPYTATEDVCIDDDFCNYSGARVTGVYENWSPSEPDMKEIVYSTPIYSSIYVSNNKSAWSTLIGRELHSVATPALLCYIRDRWLPCTERSYYRRPYAIKTSDLEMENSATRPSTSCIWQPA